MEKGLIWQHECLLLKCSVQFTYKHSTFTFSHKYFLTGFYSNMYKRDYGIRIISNTIYRIHASQMTFQRLILISISPMMLFCLPNTKHCLILLQLIPGMYKSIFRILTIVEVISNLCFLALFLSMPAWNNGKVLDSESEDPGSIPAKGEFFFKF